MSKGVIFKIYKLDRSKVEGLGENLREVPDILMKKYNEEKQEELYEKIPQTTQPNNDYELSFYKKANVARIQHKWKRFFEADGFTLGDPGTELHHIACFIYQKSSQDIFVVSTGHAYVLFEHYIDYIFPIEIGRRIAKAEIKSAETKAISGYLQASNLFFRTPRRISLAESLDSVWTKLFGSIREDILSLPTFKEIFGEKSKISLSIKTSIDINTPVENFELLMKLVNWLNSLLATEAPNDDGLEFMDTIRPLDSRKAKLDIQKLDKELINQLDSVAENFDLCHEEHSRYINAEKYSLSLGKKIVSETEVSPITTQVVESMKGNGDKLNIETLKKYRLLSQFPEEPYFDVEDTLYHHICGEVVVEDRNYFLLNGRWFSVSKDFINIVSKNFTAIAKDKELKSTVKLNDWPTNLEKEQDYNNSYKDQGNFLVGDKILVQNTELFDLLNWDKEKIRIIHVKKKFNVKIRDLASQVSNAAHIIENDMRTSQKTRLKELYQKLKNNNKVGEIAERQFIELFNRHREYVFAYAEENDSLSQPGKIGSNIAKYELVNLQSEMLRYAGNKADLKLKWIRYGS